MNIITLNEPEAAMTSLPGTPENIRTSLKRMDTDPDPELDSEGDFVVDIPLRTGFFAYRAGSMVLARRFDVRNESLETSMSFGRVDVTAAQRFGRTARAANVYFDVIPEADIADVAIEGTGRFQYLEV